MGKWFIMSSFVRRWMLLALLAAVCVPTVGAQCGDRTTQGTDFWVMFLTNHLSSYSSLSLVVTAERQTTVHLRNPRTSFDTIFIVEDHGTVTIPISDLHGNTSTSHIVSNGGLHLTSIRPVSLYASNFAFATFDMTTILPTSTLRSRYIVQTYDEMGNGEEIGFLAVQDSTVVSFVLPDSSHIGYGESLSGAVSVTLMAGQTYQLIGHNLSGIEVASNDKPFAVFQGSNCTFIGGVGACDHLYEQCFPVDYWGERFMLVSTANRPSGDMVRITASADNCVLTLNGDSVMATIDAGETYYYLLPTGTVKMLSSSEPVTVCMYLMGGGLNNNLGDPAAVIIPPVEQGVLQTTFQAVNTTLTTMHYANIVTRNEDLASLTLDNQPIGSRFSRTSWGYAYSRLSLEPGVHTLAGSGNARFLAFFYGLGTYESYAYIAASAIVDLTEKLFIDSMYTRLLTEVPQYCQGDTVHFHIETDEPGLLVSWYIDSDLVAQGDQSIAHVFDTPGDYVVSAVLHLCDTLSVPLHVNPVYDVTVADTICFNESLSWHGRTFSTDTFFTDTLRTRTYHCDSIVHLDLSVVPRPDVGFRVLVDCHDAIYQLSVDTTFVPGAALTWSSQPHDSLLDGHEHGTNVDIFPEQDTRYSIFIDNECPFSVDTVLAPLMWPSARWAVNPDRLSYEHPWIDAHDISVASVSRRWYANGELLPEEGRYLRYYAPFEVDSVLLALIVSSGTCTDTLSRAIPFGHETVWAPNAFTPGEIGNSRFSVAVNDGYVEKLLIFNRNGLLVGSFEGPHPEWDGTSNGSPCPQGAYVWQLHFRTFDQPARTQVHTGTVTLIR